MFKDEAYKNLIIQIKLLIINIEFIPLNIIIKIILQAKILFLSVIIEFQKIYLKSIKLLMMFINI